MSYVTAKKNHGSKRVINVRAIGLKYAYIAALTFIPCASLSAMASSEDALSNVEISAAVGPNWVQANDTVTVIPIFTPPDEIDSILTQHVSSTPVWKLGMGYHFFADSLSHRQFFNDLLVELNFYRSSETINGKVYQYQNPLYYTFNFSAPIRSTRLMLDAKPGLVSYDKMSFYPILGAGIAWNSSAYQETALPGTASSPLLLNANTKSSFAYDLGAGVRMDITPSLQVSLEYLYSNLGDIVMTVNPANDATLTSPPQFKLSSQTVMLGLNWKI
ncbi:MAG: outer membrane beta-barrel protein [Gammaproteobacteria bacterium]|nr:outer membrane beta-barrel protein [Gammaproteobacteria bacterium]